MVYKQGATRQHPLNHGQMSQIYHSNALAVSLLLPSSETAVLVVW
jgi:hypothetical protein